MKGLSILGSTGSIGTQTLEVVAASPERLSVAALAAHTNDALLMGFDDLKPLIGKGR